MTRIIVSARCHALLANRVEQLAETRKFPSRDVRDPTATIGVVQESAYVGSARSAFPRAILREFTSFHEMVAAASRGEILGALDNDPRLRRYLRLHPGDALRLDLEVLRDLHDPIAIAVRPDSPHLLDWINTYLLTRAPALSPQALLDRFDR